MGQDIIKIERLYDTVAREYAEVFTGEHEKKPRDQIVLKRFARMIGARRPVWDLGCGPGQTTRYLHDLGIDISGLDLSGRLLEKARGLHPGIHFQKGNLLALDFEDQAIAGGLFLLTYHIGDETLRVDEFLGKSVEIDFMFFSTDFIQATLATCGFASREVVERDPYAGVEYASRRGYVLAQKPAGGGGKDNQWK